MSRRASSPRSTGARSKYPPTSCVTLVALPSAPRRKRKNRWSRSLLRSVEIPLDQPAYGLRVQLPARDKRRAVGGRRAATDPDGTRQPRQMRRLARQLPRRPLLGELEVVLDVTLEAVRGHDLRSRVALERARSFERRYRRGRLRRPDPRVCGSMADLQHLDQELQVGDSPRSVLEVQLRPG